MLQNKDSKISIKENVLEQIPFPSFPSFLIILLSLYWYLYFAFQDSLFQSSFNVLNRFFLLRKDLEDFKTSNYLSWYFIISLWLLSVVSLFKLIKAWTIIHFWNVIMVLSAVLLGWKNKLSDNHIIRQVTQLEELQVSWVPSVLFKTLPNTTLLQAPRISVQNLSPDNIQDAEIMESQLQIQLIIEADSILFISLYKTWRKHNFSLSYGS